MDEIVFEEKNSGRGGGLFILGLFCGLLLATVAFFAVALLVGTGVIKLPSRAGGGLVDQATRRKIEQIESSIDDNFYRTDVEDDALRDGLYRGLVDALDDPYSTYYTSEEFGEIMSDIEGVYEGIGAYLMQSEDTDYPAITGTIAGSPAEKAGLVADDLLIEVEGESTKGLDLSTIVSRVRGERGTEVHIKIMRGGETKEVAIVRQKIESPTVVTEAPDKDGIGYLRITEFDDVTPGQFKDGLDGLIAEGMSGLILDLRNNTGGNLDAVCEIADYLLPEGVIVYTLDRDGNREDFNSDEESVTDFPIVVLTNGYTASASEILAGAIRDYDLGKLLGTTTYGKGVVQRIYQLGDGTAMKLTVESYYTPSGYDLNGIGLEPDEELVYDADKWSESGTDNQRERAAELLKEMSE